jgi:UDP-N-acetylglucosamine:LPS N-acetylglucosamine transferase
MTKPRIKVLALSSGGGHWVQMLRLRPAFDGCDIAYATVRRTYQADIDAGRFYVIPDCNRSQKLRLLWCAIRVWILLLRVRPDVVISTGAAPGYFAIRFGRWLRMKTIWVDSVANAEQLSMSGQIAGRHAGLWLTQWPHLASDSGPAYRGRVL